MALKGRRQCHTDRQHIRAMVVGVWRKNQPVQGVVQITFKSFDNERGTVVDTFNKSNTSLICQCQQTISHVERHPHRRIKRGYTIEHLYIIDPVEYQCRVFINSAIGRCHDLQIGCVLHGNCGASDLTAVTAVACYKSNAATGFIRIGIGIIVGDCTQYLLIVGHRVRSGQRQHTCTISRTNAGAGSVCRQHFARAILHIGDINHQRRNQCAVRIR